MQGRALDVGCGSGEHALMCAALGLEVTGVDLAPIAISRAQNNVRERGLTARFLRHDALRLAATSSCCASATGNPAKASTGRAA
ncbi:class I SAM-dependent methyltransferase [Nonomuraea sp. CA-141351]|uniref:class I SAM-dependent methyltransferase n=1 Tax=Nonomuraea sp. CA-141351 TaxID=3239996 RepID=UPI003D8D9B58